MKKIFYSELAFIIGLFAIACGTALIEKSNFGIQTEIIPAFVLFRRFHEILSFGQAEWIVQSVLIVLMAIICRKARWFYLLSFITVFLYSRLLDGFVFVFQSIPEVIIIRILLYVFGMLICQFGIALFFKTYLPPVAYDMFVNEVADCYGLNKYKLKTIYDLTSFTIGFVLSIVLLKDLSGIGIGTILCALFNGKAIDWITSLLEKRFRFVRFRDIKKGF